MKPAQVGEHLHGGFLSANGIRKQGCRVFVSNLSKIHQ
jgi:hypothetical protein